MKSTTINLWYDKDGDIDQRKCFECVPAVEVGDKLYIEYGAVKKMLSFRWPMNRWAIQFQRIRLTRRMNATIEARSMAQD